MVLLVLLIIQNILILQIIPKRNLCHFYLKKSVTSILKPNQIKQRNLMTETYRGFLPEEHPLHYVYLHSENT